jgi:predicted NUDIX family NTP pyrophosphohydrolase
MANTSAGILLYRRRSDVEVFIAHMGGPLWEHKDDRAWSIPKGLHDKDEQPLAAALREFAEEIGVPAPPAEYVHLGDFRQRSGKVVAVFAAEWDEQLEFVSSNLFEMEWPPRSGRMQQFVEMDGAGWFTVADARPKVLQGQLQMLDALEAQLT